jgi:outer membrane protein TolC
MRLCGIFLLATLACAEEHTLTLRQALDLAARQNPDLALARLDEMKARAAVKVARDPFFPRITAGSGLAYSNGFPMSIEGSAPSVFQAAAQQFLFNRPQNYQIAQAKEEARGAAIGVTAKQDEVAFRTTSMYLDAERAARIGALARKSIEDYQSILDTVHAQVALNLARAKQLAEGLEDDRATAETALAVGLGFPAEDRVHAVAEDRPAPPLPESEDRAIQRAVESNPELRQIESHIAAKQLELRGEKAARLPRADLVAQYAMLAKFNNYAEFFNHFQRNNGEIGVAFQVPIFHPGVRSQMAETEVDLNHLKVELANARNRLSSDLQQAFRAVRKATTDADVARLDLEVAREQLSVGLAQMQEGRMGMRQVEEARLAESNKWIAFYDAQYALERARWNVLRLTGGLSAALK